MRRNRHVGSTCHVADPTFESLDQTKNRSVLSLLNQTRNGTIKSLKTETGLSHATLSLNQMLPKALAELERESSHDDRELVAGGTVVANGGGRSNPVGS
jgi:hypothetical protein